MIGGEVECGPQRSARLGREGYNWGTIRARDLAESLSYGGFLKLAGQHWRMGLGEIKRSLFKSRS